MEFFIDNKIMELNHLWGIRGRSADHVIVTIHQQLVRLRALGFNVALIALDQSVFFDIISHKLLFLKMKHLNFGPEILNIIKSYMFQRKQVTCVNTNFSQIIEIGPYSVAQGSILSGTFAMIFTLDMHKITHPQNHENFTEYFKCKNPKCLIYVDDIYAIIQTKNEDIWPNIRKYIEKMQRYYDGNKLVINVDKTQVMIIKNNKKKEKQTKKNKRDKKN